MSTAMALDAGEWQDQALQLIESYAVEGRRFDAYDLSTAGVPDPTHPNMWGPLFRTAASKGLIRKVGYHESARPGRAKGVCAVWEGVPQLRGMLL